MQLTRWNKECITSSKDRTLQVKLPVLKTEQRCFNIKHTGGYFQMATNLASEAPRTRWKCVLGDWPTTACLPETLQGEL